MDSKSKILDNIRRNSPQAAPYPDIEHFVAVTYPDKVEQFIQMVAAVGGRAEVLAPDADIAATIQALYPEATRFISNLELPGLPVTPQRGGYCRGYERYRCHHSSLSLGRL